ncbi:hypothetical protein WA026_023089 [Henosepilachna vigintioctopunctata]|uniref:Uncharacterized protein n=1 Tax=Henosepilachna vigintioctopunctata TaxID=420089 RepID=A0AAW1UH13_9CUCU
MELMDINNFFATIEKMLKAPIPPRLKAHLTFHHVNNFHVAALLPEQSISFERYSEIEDFGRRILYQILEPEEVLKYYGEFKRRTGLFAFTLGERLYLNRIRDISMKIMKEQMEVRKNLKANKILYNTRTSPPYAA